jgi:hypothetical protein
LPQRIRKSGITQSRGCPDFLAFLLQIIHLDLGTKLAFQHYW